MPNRLPKGLYELTFSPAVRESISFTTPPSVWVFCFFGKVTHLLAENSISILICISLITSKVEHFPYVFQAILFSFCDFYFPVYFSFQDRSFSNLLFKNMPQRSLPTYLIKRMFHLAQADSQELTYLLQNPDLCINVPLGCSNFLYSLLSFRHRGRARVSNLQVV